MDPDWDIEEVKGAWLISFIKPDRDIKSWGGVAYNIYEFRLEQTRGEGTCAKALHNAWWLATRSLSHTEFVVCTSTETGWLARVCVNAFIWAVLIPNVNTELQSLIISDSIYSCWNCFALQLDNRGLCWTTNWTYWEHYQNELLRLCHFSFLRYHSVSSVFNWLNLKFPMFYFHSKGWPLFWGLNFKASVRTPSLCQDTCFLTVHMFSQATCIHTIYHRGLVKAHISTQYITVV